MDLSATHLTFPLIFKPRERTSNSITGERQANMTKKDESGSCVNRPSSMLTALEEAVLLLLSCRSLCGAQIVKGIQEVSDKYDGLTLKIGSVYPLMNRLLKADLVTYSFDTEKSSPSRGNTRKYYRLTPEGLSALGKSSEFRKALVNWSPKHGM